MNLLGFWSYVHADDDVDMGRVAQLARDVVAHYEALTAEQIELFLDRDDLAWGDQWKGKIDETLSNVAFFIPVITPRYFRRVECRHELQFFATRAERLGIGALIMPILYIDVPALHDDEPPDPLMKMVRQIQWRPWTEQRFADRSSSAYRIAVDGLAHELMERVREVESINVVAAVKGAEAAGASDDDEPGLIDRIAALEESMPRWSETLTAIGNEIREIGEIMARGATDINRGDAQGKGFAARLTVARRVAAELLPKVESIESLGQTYASELAVIDQGIRPLLSQGAMEVQSGVDDDAHERYCEFVGTLRGLAGSSADALGSLQEMIASSEPLDRMSKDLRPVLRRMRTSLTALLEAREVTRSWVELADSLGVDCHPEP